MHFREPGAEHKEDLATGSLAAVIGGVTAVFEMPNTNPLTTGGSAGRQDPARAATACIATSPSSSAAPTTMSTTFPSWSACRAPPGIKIFMGSSTGILLVADDDGVAAILAKTRRRASFHSEDEPRLRERRDLRVEGDPASHPALARRDRAARAPSASSRIARETGARIHVLHVSTAEEIELPRDHKDVATVEVTPQHLTLDDARPMRGWARGRR